MTVLSEIQQALGDGTITVQQVAAGLTRAQKRAIWRAMVASRLPVTVNTVKGAITITNAAIENGKLYLYGNGVIQDNADGTWRVGVHPPPLFVPDPTATDYTNADGTTFRLDPVAAVRSVLGDVVRSQS